MASILALQRISKIFLEKGREALPVLKNVSIQVRMGEFLVFLGPSGSGKSTLLRIMSGLEKSFEGKLELSSEISRSDFSFVFQQFALLPWLSVRENIGLGLVARHMLDKAHEEQVMQELQRFGLERFARAYPRELSGGMKQRVGIARALVTAPKVIFMDEPFSEVDTFTAEELRKDILKVWREKRTTIVMVSHNIEEALELADRIAVLTPRPGCIEEIFENRLPRPRNKRSQEFYRLYDELYKIIKP